MNLTLETNWLSYLPDESSETVCPTSGRSALTPSSRETGIYVGPAPTLWLQGTYR
jgi:hypothetical protein